MLSSKKNMLACFFFFVSHATMGSEEKPLRQDCISRIEIDWAGVPQVDKAKITNDIILAIVQSPRKKYNHVSPSIAVQGSCREYIYLQYSFDCGGKYENTLDLVGYIQSRVDIGISVSKKDFLPGIETIKVSGPSWVDKDEQVGRRVVIDGKPYIKVE